MARAEAEANGSGAEVELRWRGKYDDAGRRVEPEVAALQAQVTFTAAERYGGDTTAEPNRLFAGDNLAVLASLLPEFEGRLALIYLDPPFFAECDFRTRIPVGVDPQKPNKPFTTLEGLAYRDTWPGGISSYLRFLYERLALMHRLLAPTGVLFFHCDYRVAGYARLLLDEVFAPQGRLVNEICWYYKRWSAASRNFQRMHDTIFFYAKSEQYRFRPLYQPLAASTQAMHGETLRVNVPDDATGKLVTKRTEVPSKGVLMHDVWEIPFVVAHSQEQLGYPTQKPVELLARMVEATTEPGEWVADFFCGAGALPAAAEGLRVRREGTRAVYACDAEPRRWLAADASELAVHATRKRMLSLPGKEPPASFDVWCAPGRAAGKTASHNAAAVAAPSAAATLEADVERAENGRVTVRLLRYRPSLEGLTLSRGDKEKLEAALAHDPSGLCLLDAWALGATPTEAAPFQPVWHTQRPRRGGPRHLPSEITLPPELSAKASTSSTVEWSVHATDCFGRRAACHVALG